MLSDDELLPGEHEVLSKTANAWIKVDTYGLQRLPSDVGMRVLGFGGVEAIGGRLALTNYRLVFRAHPINRLHGKFSILLPTIEELLNTSRFVARRMMVRSGAQRHEFVVWGIPRLIASIQQQQRLLTPDRQERLLHDAVTHYARLGEGLEISDAFDRYADTIARVGAGLAISDVIASVAREITSDEGAQTLMQLPNSPIELTTLLNIVDFILDASPKT